MTRSELEHIIRAAGDIAKDREIVIFGSQAILGEYPDAAPELLASMAADVFPLNHPERADKIEGAIGEFSRFHDEFGYYAQGVSPSTATLPRGWRKRLVRIKNENTGGIAGLCLEVHDLAMSKYVAAREKDLAFTRVLVQEQLIDRDKLLQRLAMTAVTPEVRKLVQGRIERDFRLV
jgi:hypothetical protein